MPDGMTAASLGLPGQQTKRAAFLGPDYMAVRQRCDQAINIMRSERSAYFTMWRDISHYIIPQRGRFVMPPAPNDTYRGTPKQQAIIDRTATKALKAMAAFLMAGITSPARDWVKLATMREELNDDHDVKAFLAECVKRILTILSASNFYNAAASLYEELGAFGTGVMLCLPDFENVMRFTTLTAGEYLLLASKSGRIDTCYRELVMNVQSLVAEFGYENCSPQVQGLYDAKQFSREVNVVHAIFPNHDRKAGRVNWMGMEFLSVRYEYGQVSDQCLDVAGFHECPFIAPRWDVVATDVYGHGPAEEALPDVKMLQILRRRHAEAADKLVKPPMSGPASLRNSLVSLVPGGFNFVPDQIAAGAQMRPIFEINPAGIQALKESVDDTRMVIQAAFYGDLIAQFSQGDTPDMTAREVDERHEEKVLLLGPMLERFHDEGLGPVIDILFNRMSRVGLLPTKGRWAAGAQKVAGQHLEPEFISLLAQAQRAVGTASIEQLYKFAAGIVGIDPSAADNLDNDAAINAYADMIGVSPEVVRSAVQVAQIRQQRAQQEQQAQQAQQGQAAVQAAQTLSQTDVGGGQNALQAMTGINQ